LERVDLGLSCENGGFEIKDLPRGNKIALFEAAFKKKTTDYADGTYGER